MKTVIVLNARYCYLFSLFSYCVLMCSYCFCRIHKLNSIIKYIAFYVLFVRSIPYIMRVFMFLSCKILLCFVFLMVFVENFINCIKSIVARIDKLFVNYFTNCIKLSLFYVLNIKYDILHLLYQTVTTTILIIFTL